ncbi:MAG: FAD:protein FMN transferase, partial [Treponema sp.]|nr:FAD:protein FMN transferase [Treponema sp.]
ALIPVMFRVHRPPALVFALLSFLVIFLSCCQKAGEGGGSKSSSRSLPAQSWEILGTVCSVNAFEDGGEKLYGEIRARLQEIDEAFSANRTSSDVSCVNSAAGKNAVSVRDGVFFVIKTALSFAERSGGVFDPTIGPLVKLWGIGTDHQKVPSQEEIDAALALVDWRKVSLEESGRSVFLEDEGMALDLGGIAKGYAADELVCILKARQVSRAIIDLGGNVYVYGSKKDGSKWKVGIKNPLDGGQSVASVLELGDGLSVVTSGNYERYFISEGKRYHHIIDPKTGFPGGGNVASATIVSSSSMEADAMSTTAFLMGMEAFQQAFPSVACIFMLSDGSVSASNELTEFYGWLR